MLYCVYVEFGLILSIFRRECSKLRLELVQVCRRLVRGRESRTLFVFELLFTACVVFFFFFFFSIFIFVVVVIV